LSELVEQHLRFLDFPHARFVVSVTPKNSLEPARDGIDLIEFLWQPNPGEPAHPLSKIASGGEASRVMLAIKASLAAVDDIGTFIFDEIDTGVSGHAGQAVAHTMRDLGKARQVISISHLPAIAAAADAHLMVEKEVKAGHTETQVYALNDSERIREVARMLAGSTDDISLRHAAALMTLMGKNTN
jgi:DNA repair protein RecN (Recombination protein N)